MTKTGPKVSLTTKQLKKETSIGLMIFWVTGSFKFACEFLNIPFIYSDLVN